MESQGACSTCPDVVIYKQGPRQRVNSYILHAMILKGCFRLIWMNIGTINHIQEFTHVKLDIWNEIKRSFTPYTRAC